MLHAGPAWVCTCHLNNMQIQRSSQVQSRYAALPRDDDRVLTNTAQMATMNPRKTSFCNKLRPSSFDALVLTRGSLGFSNFGGGCLMVTSSSSPSTVGSADPTRPSVKKIKYQRFQNAMKDVKRPLLIYSSPRIPSSGTSSSPLFAILTVFLGLSPGSLSTL